MKPTNGWRARARVSLALWPVLGVLLLAIAGYFGFHALFVKVGRSVEQPFSGPARHNEWYVLQRYLEARGLQVRTVRDWPQPLSSRNLVLWFAHDDVPRELRSWLAAGGQMWAFQDPDGTPEEEWTYTPWPGEEEEEEAGSSDAGSSDAQDDAVVGAFTDAGVEAFEPAMPGEGDAGAENGAPEDGGAPEIDDDWCADGCLQAAQFRYGEGRLTLVYAYALHNERVVLGETPARIDALLSGAERPALVYMVASVGSPWFGQLLYERAPGALLACAALLGLALWRAGTHFGPRHPLRRTERRQILEHIGAVATLASRVGLTPLVAAARHELRQQLLKRIPQGTTLTSAALVEAVVAATDLPEREVQRALLDEPNGLPQDALAIARALQALWRKI